MIEVNTPFITQILIVKTLALNIISDRNHINRHKLHTFRACDLIRNVSKPEVLGMPQPFRIKSYICCINIMIFEFE